MLCATARALKRCGKLTKVHALAHIITGVHLNELFKSLRILDETHMLDKVHSTYIVTLKYFIYF